MTEATASSNKIWPAECRKNPLVTDATLWVILPLCLLPLFITRRDKGGPDSQSLRIGKAIQRNVSGVGSGLDTLPQVSMFCFSAWSTSKTFKDGRRKEYLYDYSFLFQVPALLVSKHPEMCASLANYAKISSCSGKAQTSNLLELKCVSSKECTANICKHIWSMQIFCSANVFERIPFELAPM